MMSRLADTLHTRLSKPFTRFFNARAPRQDHQHFTLKNTYVFFSRQGVLFFLLLIITFIAGVNYGNNLILGLFFYLMSLWLVAAVVTFLQVASLSIKLNHLSLAQAGGLMWADITISNRHGKAARQIQLGFDDIGADTTGLSDSERLQYQRQHRLSLNEISGDVHVRLPIIAQRRGSLTLPRLTVVSRYPLGVVQAWAYARFASVGYAHPKPLAFSWQDIKHPSTADDDADSPVVRMGHGDFEHLDHYQAGESLARVSWTHVARGMGMLSKRFGEAVASDWQLDYDAMPAIHHEDKLAQLAYALIALKGTQMPFVLTLPNDVGQLGAGDEFIQAGLMRLAKAP